MRHLVPLLLVSAAAALVTGLGAQEQGGIRVENVAAATVLGYPVAFLKGTAALPDGSELSVQNPRGRGADGTFRTRVQGGRFKALIPLEAGENLLELSSGAVKLPFRLAYQPATSDYRVRIFYYTDRTGDTTYQTERPGDPQDYAAKLDTVAKLLQTFTAERMNDAGYGRKTFNLELQPDGKVQVRTVRGPETMAYYHRKTGNELWSEIGADLNRRFPDPKAKNVVVMAFTRWDAAAGQARAHTALGGGNLALFGSAGMFTWPGRIADTQLAFEDTRRVDPRQTFDDSNGRSTCWGLASTTLGAVLHETGHTLGLPHSRDPLDIMTRGFDHLNRFFTLVEPPHAGRPTPYAFPEGEVARWGSVSTGRLAFGRWLQPDVRAWRDQPAPGATLDSATRKVLIRSDLGLRVVGINGAGDGWDNDVFRAEAPRRQEYDLDTLVRRAGGKGPALTLIDAEGNFTDVGSDVLADPADFVRTWRYSAAPVPWPAPGTAFVEADVGRITEELRRRTPRIFSSALVDLANLYAGNTDNRVAYLLCVLRSPLPVSARLFTGSDDALRVWVNGRLCQSKLALRSARPDEDQAAIELQAGDNPVLVEVSNGGGGWGFFFRLEDATGRKLRVAPDGSVQF